VVPSFERWLKIPAALETAHGPAPRQSRTSCSEQTTTTCRAYQPPGFPSRAREKAQRSTAGFHAVFRFAAVSAPPPAATGRLQPGSGPVLLRSDCLRSTCTAAFLTRLIHPLGRSLEGSRGVEGCAVRRRSTRLKQECLRTPQSDPHRDWSADGRRKHGGLFLSESAEITSPGRRLRHHLALLATSFWGAKEPGCERGGGHGATVMVLRRAVAGAEPHGKADSRVAVARTPCWRAGA